MATSELIGKLFSSQIVAGLVQVTPYVAVAQDRSNEVRGSGDGLIIALTGGGVNVADYPANGAINYGALAPTKAELDIDKKKYVAFEVEDTDNAQISFDLFGDAVRQSARELASQVAADFRAALAGETVPNSQTESVSFTAAGSTKTEREALHLAIYDIAAALKTKGFEQRPYIFVHPAVHRELIKYLTIDRNGAPTSQTESAFIDGMLSGVYGVDIIPDWGASAPGTLNGADCYAGIRNRTLVYGQQVNRPERGRSPDRFADRYRVLNTYGAGVQDTASLFKLDVGAA